MTSQTSPDQCPRDSKGSAASEGGAQEEHVIVLSAGFKCDVPGCEMRGTSTTTVRWYPDLAIEWPAFPDGWSMMRDEGVWRTICPLHMNQKEALNTPRLTMRVPVSKMSAGFKKQVFGRRK